MLRKHLPVYHFDDVCQYKNIIMIYNDLVSSTFGLGGCVAKIQ